MTCGMCESKEVKPFFRDEKRQWDYFQCSQCELVFRDPETYLPHEEEKARYQTHNNSIENEGYVKFLSPVVNTLLPYLQAGQQGLDFGSGPGPILDQLFAKEGIGIKNYDPYFDYHPHYLDEKYDFITCTEVFEHFTIPFKEIVTITNALKPNGYLMIMTEKYQDLEHFKNWGYRMDPTHICFLNDKTLDWMSQEWNYKPIHLEGRLFLFQKQETNGQPS